jgi:hypothetical protein
MRGVFFLLGWLMLCGTAMAQISSDSAAVYFSSPSAADAHDAPISVRTGLFVTQITDVNQKEENFTVVAQLRMEWTDPRLAFDPVDFNSDRRVMSSQDFIDFARANNVSIPVVTFQNLQTRSFDKASAVYWTSAGDATHISETVLTLQAPDFEFRQYPFDEQKFFLRLVMNNPMDAFVFEDLEGFSGMGPALGEEEWIVRDVRTLIDQTRSIAGWESDRFSLVFSADRHLIYYWTRIFVPLMLLVIVSWANLFLEEYRRRIDIAGANLLAFIAFNFAVSGDLPRLGYVTFLDALMLAMFVHSALTVAYNVMLRRFSVTGHDHRAKRLDWHTTYWGFPVVYILTVMGLWVAFFP